MLTLTPTQHAPAQHAPRRCAKGTQPRAATTRPRARAHAQHVSPLGTCQATPPPAPPPPPPAAANARENAPRAARARQGSPARACKVLLARRGPLGASAGGGGSGRGGRTVVLPAPRKPDRITTGVGFSAAMVLGCRPQGRVRRARTLQTTRGGAGFCRSAQGLFLYFAARHSDAHFEHPLPSCGNVGARGGSTGHSH